MLKPPNANLKKMRLLKLNPANIYLFKAAIETQGVKDVKS